MRSCDLHECPREATHKVVWNPVGYERYSEYYCEPYAEVAAEEAEKDESGDLFLSPTPIE